MRNTLYGRGTRWSALGGSAAWVIVLFLLPMALLAAISLGSTNAVGQPNYGLSAGNYLTALHPLFLPVLIRTVVYAVIVAATCSAAGYAVAYTLVTHGGRFRNLLLAAAVVPWLVDYLIRIYAWLTMLGPQGPVAWLLRQVSLGHLRYDGAVGSTAAVLLGLIYNFLPFAIVTCYVSIEQIDLKLVEAARDLYARRSTAFWRVTLPLTTPGLVGSAALAFLPTLGDFAVVQLLGSPRQFMLGNLINDQFSNGGSIPLAASFTMILFIALALVALCVLALRSRARTGSGRAHA